MPVDVVRCPQCLTDNPATATRCARCDLLLVGELLPILPDAEPTSAVELESERPTVPLDPRMKVLGGVVVVLVIALFWALGARHRPLRSTAADGGGRTPTTALPNPIPLRLPTTVPSSSIPVTTAPSGDGAVGGVGDAGGATPGVTAATTTTTVPFLPEKSGTKLTAVSGTGRVTVIDLDASALVDHDLDELQVPESDMAPADVVPPLIRRGSSFVFPGADGAVLAAPLDMSTPAHRLGDAFRVLASINTDRVWLVGRTRGAPATIEEHDSFGRVTAGPVAIPTDFEPVATMADGVVLTQAGVIEVWDPITGAVRFRTGSNSWFRAAAGHVVAWSAGCDPNLCPLHLTTLPRGDDRVVYVQGDGVGRAVFSPDGHWLAYERQASAAGSASRPQLAIIDVDRATVSAVALPGSSQGVPVWNSAGTWVFGLGLDGGAGGQIYAFRRGAAAATPVRMTWHGRLAALLAS